MEALVHQKTKLILILVKQIQSLSLHHNSDNSYLFVNRKESYEFKASNKNVNFPSQFFLGSISNKFRRSIFKRKHV